MRRLHAARARFAAARNRKRQLFTLESLEVRVMLCADHGVTDLFGSATTNIHDTLAVTSASATTPGNLRSTRPEPTAAQAAVMAQASGSSSTTADILASASVAANGMPQLDSLPGAHTAVFLDFDGDTASGTTAYDEDGDPTTFNAAEQAHIVEAWRQLSAYFAMFDTDVTTVPPSVPFAWDVIGNNISGGYSYVGVFPNSSVESFNNSGDARTRESGLAHEVGHNFGLWHQSDYSALGVKTNEYSSGFDSLHGPIMGVDYAQSVHKWFIGHPSNSATALQDDLAIIAGKIKAYEPAGGDGFRTDDYLGTIAGATALTDNGAGAQSAAGIIERMTDVDAFSFSSLGGVTNILASPDAPSGVDLKLEIYDAAGNLLAAKDGATNDQQISLALGAGTYYALVSSHGNYGDLGMYKMSATALPTGWASQDIGSVGIAGSSQFDSATGTFTVAGSGSDVWNTADSGPQYAYETLSGDGSITAKVTSQQNTSGWAKSGVMIRESLASNSKQAFMLVSPSNGTAFQYRAATGGASANTNTAGFAAPYWVRLTRTGSTITGFRSADGVTWTQQGTATISMASNVYIGLAVTATNNSALSAATFTNVAFTGSINPAATFNGLAAPANLAVAVGTGTGTGLNLSWSDVAGETGFAVDRSSDGVNFAQVGTTAAGVLTYSDNNLAGSMRYFYRVHALNASGQSVPSTVASGINRPSAVTNMWTESISATNIVVNWRDTSGETGYRIERSTDNVTFTQIATVGANVPAYNNTGLVANTVYYYRVTPMTAQGDSVSATISASTRLAAVTGTSFTARNPTSLSLQWTDIAGETTYRIERSTDGTTYSALATVGQNVTTYTDSTVTPLTEYYYRVVGVNALTESASATAIFTATPAAAALPAPWAASDIGSIPGVGATGLASGTFTVLSSGADIWGTADAFRFTYQTLIGDGSITARVASQENTASNTKVGVMIRQSLASNSAHVSTIVMPSGMGIEARATAGASTTWTQNTASTAPYWLRISRVGNVFTSQLSPDGVTWTTAGTATVTMTGTVYIGLAADSANASALNTSTFDNVTVANAAPTVATPAAASPSTVTAKTTNLSVLGADDHAESNLTYTWAATTLPAGAAAPTYSVNGTNASKNTTATFSKAGTYGFTVTMTDLGGLTTTSTVNVTVNQTLTAIGVSPNSVNLAGNATQQFTASATDQFGDAMSAAVTWSATAGSIDTTGFYTAPNNTTSATITATSGAISGSATAAITAVVSNGAPTVSIAAAATPSPVTGTTTALSVLGDDDNGEANLTYSWAATALPVGAAAPTYSVNGTNAAKNTTATFTKAGDYTFTVTITDAGSLTTTSTVNVTVNQTLTSITVTPASISLNAGGTQQFSATAFDQFAAALVNQPAITWSKTGAGTLTAAGLYTADNTSGSATVTATSGGVSSSDANVTVTNLAPTVATPAAASPSPVTGTTTALSVLGADDAGQANLTYTWAATTLPAGAAAPTYSVNGTNASKNTTATFSQAGDYTFTVTIADAGSLTTTSAVNVTVNQTLTSITVTPSSISLNAGGTQQFSATAFDQFAAALVNQPAITWSKTGSGSISAAGLYTAANVSGSATVTATSGAVSSVGATVTVTNLAPTVATPAAASPSPVTGTTTALSVLGSDDAGQANLTYSWAATTLPAGAAAPTYSVNGTNASKNTTATFTKAGDYTFTVTITDAGGLTTTSAVNVTVNQTLTSITVTPASISLNAGGTQQFSATAFDQFAAALVNQPAITWSKTGSGSISASGFYTAASTSGSATVTATSGAVSSSGATVTVTNLAPTVATPAAASPSPVTGTTTALSVLGADDAGQANLTYTWAATTLPAGAAAPTYSVNGTNAAKNTTATFTKAGAYTFTVTLTDAGGLTTTSDVNVTVNQTLTSIVLSPATVTLNASTTQQFSATARDQFAAAMSVQPALTWAVVGAGSITQTGLFTAPTTSSSSTVTATSGAISGSAAVTTILNLPAAPTNLTVTKLNNRKVKLTWKDNATNESGYYVQTSTDGINWTTYATRAATAGSGSTVSYTTGSFPAGKRYFRVLAYIAPSTLSTPSNVVSVTL